jgi:hypothetical protein
MVEGHRSDFPDVVISGQEMGHVLGIGTIWSLKGR